MLEGHTGRVTGGGDWAGVMAVAVNPNGDIITGSWDKTAIIWSPEGEQKRVLKGHTGWVNAIACSNAKWGHCYCARALLVETVIA